MTSKGHRQEGDKGQAVGCMGTPENGEVWESPGMFVD